MTPTYAYNFLQSKLHFTTLDPNYDMNYSSMTVGGMRNGTNLLELVASYQIFGNGGKYYDPHFVSQIIDREGNIIYENSNFYEK
jgi:penicillin-binding protein 1A